MKNDNNDKNNNFDVENSDDKNDANFNANINKDDGKIVDERDEEKKGTDANASLEVSERAKRVDEVLEAMFFLLRSESTECYSNILKLFSFLAKAKNSLPLFQRQSFAQLLTETLDSSSSILKTRGFELVVFLSEAEQPELEDLLRACGALSKTVSLYSASKDDLLERLALIELMKRFARSSSALHEMQAQGLIDSFKADMASPETAMYARRDLAVILAHFFNSFLIPPEAESLKALHALVAEWLGKAGEERNAAFELATELFKSGEALQRLASDSNLLALLLATEFMKEHQQSKGLALRTQILVEPKVSLATKKSNESLSLQDFCSFLCAFYGGEAARSFHLASNDHQNKTKVLLALEGLAAACRLPFDEVEAQHLKVVAAVLNNPALVVQLTKVSDFAGFVEYVNRRGSSSPAVVEARVEVKRKLLLALRELALEGGELAEAAEKALGVLEEKEAAPMNVASESV